MSKILGYIVIPVASDMAMDLYGSTENATPRIGQSVAEEGWSNFSFEDEIHGLPLGMVQRFAQFLKENGMDVELVLRDYEHEEEEEANQQC